MVTSTGCAALPIVCSAKPKSSATSRVWSTSPSVSEENSVVGMMPRMKSVVDSFSATWSAPAAADSSVRLMPSPGWMMLPTTRPMASANVDIVRK